MHKNNNGQRSSPVRPPLVAVAGEAPSASLKKNPCSAVFHGPGCSRPTNSTSVTHVHRARSVGQRNFPPLPRPILHFSDYPSRSTSPFKQNSTSSNWGLLPGPISTPEPLHHPNP